MRWIRGRVEKGDFRMKNAEWRFVEITLQRGRDLGTTTFVENFVGNFVESCDIDKVCDKVRDKGQILTTCAKHVRD